jgi:putative restriction endonuclease
MALGQLANTGSSALPWLTASERLATVIEEFGPASKASPAQRAAYPFTRLRSDKVWTLDHNVPMDLTTPLTQHGVVGRLEESLEQDLIDEPGLLNLVARTLVTAHFPDSIAADVLTAVGLDSGVVLADPALPETPATRRRNTTWRIEILQSWDRQCAFCGYDGQILGASVGLDAAHVRWFALDGPDTMDNGLALCVLHHKLFDLGVLGLTIDLRIQVSTTFTARTHAGRAVYELHGRELEPRPGTIVPAEPHLAWHRTQVFKGRPLTASG